MAIVDNIQEFQSYVIQTRMNLAHYEQRREHLAQLRDEGKSYFSLDGTDLIPIMIAEEESAIQQYREVLKELELKVSKATTDSDKSQRYSL